MLEKELQYMKHSADHFTRGLFVTLTIQACHASGLGGHYGPHRHERRGTRSSRVLRVLSSLLHFAWKWEGHGLYQHPQGVVNGHPQSQLRGY